MYEYYGALLVLCLASGLGVISIYKVLIGKKNEVQYAEDGLNTCLKQRYELIPNLISSVQNHMRYESELIEKIVQLRVKAVDLNVAMSEKDKFNNEISKGLLCLLMQVEHYPEIKASENFKGLQDTLYEVEHNIAVSRKNYNAAVTEYNNDLEMFPHNVMASIIQFKRKRTINIPEMENRPMKMKDIFKSKVA